MDIGGVKKFEPAHLVVPLRFYGHICSTGDSRGAGGLLAVGPLVHPRLYAIPLSLSLVFGCSGRGRSQLSHHLRPATQLL